MTFFAFLSLSFFSHICCVLSWIHVILFFNRISCQITHNFILFNKN
jgi:hypothetical protein